MEKVKQYWKQIAIGLSVVFLAIAGYLVYAFEVKEYDTADEEVDEITKDEIEVDLPDDTTITVDEDGEVTTEETDKEEEEEKDEETTEDTATDTGTTGSTNSGSASTATAANTSTSSSATPAKASASNGSANNGSSNNGSSNNGSSNANSGSNNNTSYNNNNASNGSGRVTVSQIKDRYDTALNGLEDTANDRLDSLVSRAKREYQNDDNVSYARYYSKYTSAAEELENRADAAFYAIVAVMERDLKANGLAASHTKSVINEYENKKKQRKNALLKKAAGLK
ncbi:hypothetical protein QMA09_15285 [Planococcus sp. APC 3906]|uniref:hypothetical protein n=1 Tax=Planococcus sp. APC 3906 TaxID=3035194 RepID=UPI0025B351D6|nr:hypothetical protein [Planococcus sp. APC 3906]MDN3451562.1 hypothetical protein [Planococcus sp. APC 3906]